MAMSSLAIINSKLSQEGHRKVVVFCLVWSIRYNLLTFSFSRNQRWLKLRVSRAILHFTRFNYHHEVQLGNQSCQSTNHGHTILFNHL